MIITKFNIVLISIVQKTMENFSLSPRREQKQRVDEDKAKQINSYITHRVMPIFSPLQVEIMTKQPKDIHQFSINWLKNYGSNTKQQDNELMSDDEPEEMFREKMKKKLRGRKRGRAGVSGDITKQGFRILDEKLMSSPKYDWPQQIKVNLLMHLRKCVFFQHLSTQNLLKLISHMRSVEYKEGEVVIKEGDTGNELFIVDEGLFRCQKKDNDQMLKKYGVGQIFGELSLLYNHPRASTITAMTNGRLFGLGRQQFSLILRGSMVNKLRQCQQLVGKVEIFQNLNIYQRSKLFQSMEVRSVGPEKYIIRQGEVGNCFYIVAEGQLVAYKMQKGELKLVYAFKRGDYFGEIALLKNVSRQASIKTLTDSKLIFINRDTFSRVLGPLETILRRNQQRYARFRQEKSGQQCD